MIGYKARSQLSYIGSFKISAEGFLYMYIRGVTIHRYVLVSANFGWRYNTLIQAARIAIESKRNFNN